jgi:hypothetical protein
LSDAEKKTRSKRVADRRRQCKVMAVAYLGGKCSRCGYDKCIAALEFDHIDPVGKKFSMSDKGLTRSWDKIAAELDKCQLLCANCHRERHYQ